MQEKAHGSLRPPRFDQPRQQHQVIIVNPQDVIGSDDVYQRITEDLIDLFVLLPVVGLIFGKSRKVVKQRPNRRIAKPEIELLHLFFAEKHRVRLEGTERLSDQLALERDLDGASRPADPKVFHAQSRSSSARLHEGRQARDQAAGALVEGYLSVLHLDIEGQAIGDYNESSLGQCRMYQTHLWLVLNHQSMPQLGAVVKRAARDFALRQYHFSGACHAH